MSGTISGTNASPITLASPTHLSPVPVTGTISGIRTSPITLTSPTYSNPVTVTGTITLSSTGTDLSAATLWTIDNQGVIEGPTGHSYGIVLGNGGSVSNTGTISSGYGIAIDNASGAVDNSGRIDGTSYSGIALNYGGVATNTSTGVILGSQNGVTGGPTLAGMTITNYGTITGASGDGVRLDGGGTVANYAGMISGGTFGVDILDGAGTVLNAGTISSTGGDAVRLASGSANKVGMLASAVFVGTVDGGNTIGSSFVSTLELGVTSSASATIGTLTGLGTKFIDFGKVKVDQTASWDFNNTDTLAAGATLLDKGTIGGSGVTLVGDASVTVTSTGKIHRTDSPTGLNAAVYAKADPSGGATIVNYGLISDKSGTPAAVALLGGGTLTNEAHGTIAAAAVGVYAGGTAATNITNAGAIGGGLTGILFTHGAGTITNNGSISGLGGTAIRFASGDANRLVIGANAYFGGTVSGGGGTNATIELLTATSTGTLSGIGSQFVGFNDIVFDTGAQWLVQGTTSGFTNLFVQDFAAGDTLDITGIVASSESYNAGTLTLTNGPQTTTIDLPGSFTTVSFHILADTAGTGTLIEIACYLHGTRILTPEGERPVEDLRIGDRVLTLSGAAEPIKWIGRRSYARAFIANNPNVVPVRIAAGALGENVPRRDLLVSPEHALFLDGVLVPAAALVNGVSITRDAGVDPVCYVHIELARHDIIIAEGAGAETFVDCNSRAMFHNAGEFHALYPADDALPWAFCAPRVADGPRLAAIRARIDARAGIAPAPAAALEGWLDEASPRRISGWAWMPEAPYERALLDITDDEGLIARVIADQFRPDLQAAGKGDGRHGFALGLAAPLDPRRAHTIRVRRAADGAELIGSPLLVPANTQPDIETGVDPAGLRARLREAAAEARAQRHADPNGLIAWASAAPQKRALVIDETWPDPARDAGSNAILSHVDLLQSLGYHVAFAALADAPSEPPAALAARGVPMLAQPFCENIEEALPLGWSLIYLHRLRVAEAYTALARLRAPGARLVFSVADLHHHRLARQAGVLADAGLAARAREIREREIMAMRLADAVITHSPAEAAHLAAIAPGANVHVVPWVAAPRPVRRGFARRQGVGFLGGAAHAPNRDAALWLAREIMPLVWREAPDITLTLIGQGWEEVFAGPRDARIRLAGQVATLSAALGALRLTVAPLRFGAGLKGKVLESLAHGLALRDDADRRRGLRAG